MKHIKFGLDQLTVFGGEILIDCVLHSTVCSLCVPEPCVVSFGILYPANSVPSTRCLDESNTLRFFIDIFSQIPICFANDAGTNVRVQIGHFFKFNSIFVDGITSSCLISCSNSIGSGVCTGSGDGELNSANT